MKNKTTNVILWILSVFFLLSVFIMLPTSWAAIFFIVPAILLNPVANNLLQQKFNFNNKWWIKLCSALIPLIIYGAVAPATSTTATPSLASSVVTSSTVTSSQSYTSSVPVSSVVNSLSASSNLASSSALEVAAPTPTAGAKLKIHFINVGQGDSEFIELPNGQTMLIDAGNPENGSQIVSYIKSLGYSKIDTLVATHPHADHIGGMAEVVNDLNIGKIYMPKVTTTTKTYEGLLTAIQSKGLKVNTAKSGINLSSDGNLNIDMIAPVGTSYDDLNQYSAVIKISYGDNTFLFMGDAGNTSEAQITDDVKADVLKVGHHGSNTATSASFLKKVSPKYAVIEVGAGNSYGHPTAATLSKLQNIGATIYRTDKDGTIIFTSDAKTITIDKKASTIKQQAPPATSASTSKAPSSVPKVTSKAATVTPPANNQGVTVYITDIGKKYHVDGCRYLKSSKHAISLKNAKAEGYEPCSVCNPPQ